MAILLLHLALGSARGVTRARAAPDNFKVKLASFLACLLPTRLATFAATDVNLLSYVIPKLRRRDTPPGYLAFDYHRQIRPLLLVFISLASVEAAAGHLMLLHAGPIARWTVFVISDVGLLYFIALAASLGKLPLLVGSNKIIVRAGIFIELDIPIDAVASVQGSSGQEQSGRGGSLNTALMSSPTVYIELSRDITAHVPLKGTRQVRRAGVRPDDPAAFIRAVEGAVNGFRQYGPAGPTSMGLRAHACVLQRMR
ncbi:MULTISPECIES: hypothetical protein [unclassified Sphingomonas]|uniref:hypothetical protein n=1 Tax=unclassified Sphingomonas TaxID=196159 RepID=UPI00226AE896|nr:MULTISPECIES: hypothetical protein [unclassified Sphingomonas]